PPHPTVAPFSAAHTAGTLTLPLSAPTNTNNKVTPPAHSTITYVASGTIPESASGTISNTATVTAPNGVTDHNPGNNSATDTSTITFQADLTVSVDDNKTTYTPGQGDTYTIVALNNGPSNVTGVDVTDIFPSVFTDVTFTATQTGG